MDKKNDQWFVSKIQMLPELIIVLVLSTVVWFTFFDVLRSETPLINPQRFSVGYLLPFYVPIVVGICTFVCVYLAFRKNKMKTLRICYISFLLLILFFNLRDVIFRFPAGPDAFWFLQMNSDVMEKGYVSPHIIWYHQFPASFILFAELQMVTGIDPNILSHVVLVFYSLILLMIFLNIANKKAKQHLIPLYIVFFYVLSSPMFVFQLSAQTPAYLLAMLLIFFVSNKENKQSRIIFIVLFFAITIMHSITPVFVILYLVISQILKAWKGSVKHSIPPFEYTFILSMIYLTWNFFSAPYNSALLVSKATQGVESLAKLIPIKLYELVSRGKLPSFLFLKSHVAPNTYLVPQWLNTVASYVLITFIVICIVGLLIEIIGRKFDLFAETSRLALAGIAFFLIVAPLDLSGSWFALRGIMFGIFIIFGAINFFVDRLIKADRKVYIALGLTLLISFQMPFFSQRIHLGFNQVTLESEASAYEFFAVRTTPGKLALLDPHVIGIIQMYNLSYRLSYTMNWNESKKADYIVLDHYSYGSLDTEDFLSSSRLYDSEFGIILEKGLRSSNSSATR